MKTFSAKTAEVEREWLVIDVAGRSIGRAAVEIAKILRGKHKPIFTRHADTGDFVIVINADKLVLSGTKGSERVYHHTGWPGALKSTSRADELAKKPEEALRRVVKGMLPHNSLGADTLAKLKVYAGPDHPHAAQKPVEFVPSAFRGE